MKELPEIEMLRQLISYDPISGDFIWKRNGATAGCIYKNGYRYIRINGSSYRSSRIALKISTGEDPIGWQIDHVNGVRCDDRICNLRICSNAENVRNQKKNIRNTTGYKGVTIQSGCYRAQIQVNGRHVSLGMFSTPEEAHQAYVKAAKKLFKRFARYE